MAGREQHEVCVPENPCLYSSMAEHLQAALPALGLHLGLEMRLCWQDLGV